MARGGVGARPIVLQIMTGRRNPVSRAPLSDRTREIFQKQLVHRFVKVETRGRTRGRTEIEVGQHAVDRVAAPTRELRLQQAAEMQSPPPRTVRISRQMRFVAEDGGARFPVGIAQFFAVSVVGRLQKQLGGLRIEQTRVGEPAVPRHRFHALEQEGTPGGFRRQRVRGRQLRRDPVLDPVNGERTVGRLLRKLPEPRGEIAHLGLRREGRNMAAGEAARIRMLVVKRGHHPQPPAFRDAMANDLEPARRKVFGDQPRTRMQKNSTVADAGHVLQQLGETRLARPRQVFVVQDKQRPWTEFVRRIDKTGQKGGGERCH